MKPTNFIYVVLSSYNDYNQHGSYFEGVFKKYPTVEQLVNLLGVNEHIATELLEMGTWNDFHVTFEIVKEGLL